MTKDTQAFIFAAFGMLLTMLGVGGIEHSVTDTALLQSLAVSVLGLCFMWIATVILKSVDTSTN